MYKYALLDPNRPPHLLSEAHWDNLKRWVKEADFCYLCEAHPSRGHGENCPLGATQ